MDVGTAFKARQMWSTFKKDHPKFTAFLSAAAGRKLSTGSIITVEIKYPEGTSVKTNFKVNENDEELFRFAGEVLSQ